MTPDDLSEDPQDDRCRGLMQAAWRLGLEDYLGEISSREGELGVR